MKKTGHKKLDDLIEHLLSRGWKLTYNGRHKKLTSPVGKTVTMSKTCSDYRALENAYHVLKRVAKALGEVE